MNIYILDSPLQMISALIAAKNTNSNILIVKLSPSINENRKQLLSLIAKNENIWDSIRIIESSKNPIVTFIKSILLVKQLKDKCQGKVESLYFGEFRSLVIHIIRLCLKAKNEYLIDDGAITISIQSKYILNNCYYFPANSLLDKLRYKLLCIIFRVNLMDLDAPDLFSFFDFKNMMLTGQINTYPRQYTQTTLVNKNVVYFFGSKYSENKLMSESDELKLIELAVKYLSHLDFVYIPHRGDSEEKVNKIRNKRIKVLSLNEPAEVYFDSKKIMPEYVAGFWSTVLYSAYIRFENVRCISFDNLSCLINPTEKTRAKEVYSYFSNVGIDVIPFDEVKCTFRTENTHD